MCFLRIPVSKKMLVPKDSLLQAKGIPSSSSANMHSSKSGLVADVFSAISGFPRNAGAKRQPVASARNAENSYVQPCFLRISA